MAVASPAGSHAAHLSPSAAEHLAASNALAKLSDSIRDAGSATLHGGAGGESGSGSATLVGADGSSSILGGSGAAAGSGGAFSFDTVQVGGAQLMSNFVSGAHSVGGYSVAADHDQGASSAGGQQISFDDGKTVVTVKGTGHHG